MKRVYELDVYKLAEELSEEKFYLSQMRQNTKQ